MGYYSVIRNIEKLFLNVIARDQRGGFYIQKIHTPLNCNRTGIKMELYASGSRKDRHKPITGATMEKLEQ